MEIRERIRQAEDGIYILRNDSGQSSLYCGRVRLKDMETDESSLEIYPYYEPGSERDSYIILLNHGESVFLREKSEDGSVEECFYTFQQPSRPKSHLRIRIKRNIFYRKRGCLIRFRLEDGEEETIAAGRFWVEYKGRKYNFPLKNLLEPDTAAHKKKDWYVLNLPEGVRADELKVKADELVMSKYELIY